MIHTKTRLFPRSSHLLMFKRVRRFDLGLFPPLLQCEDRMSQQAMRKTLSKRPQFSPRENLIRFPSQILSGGV